MFFSGLRTQLPTNIQPEYISRQGLFNRIRGGCFFAEGDLCPVVELVNPIPCTFSPSPPLPICRGTLIEILLGEGGREWSTKRKGWFVAVGLWPA